MTDESRAAPPAEGPAEPEVVEAGEDGGIALDGSKLMRIGSMTRAMLNEAREAQLDEAGRRRLQEIHTRSLAELEGVLPDELRAELAEIFPPFGEGGGVASESEIRIAQAQLVGWLEGLFNGIQAALFTQQMAARSQLEQMRRQHALEASGKEDERYGGVYL